MASFQLSLTNPKHKRNHIFREVFPLYCNIFKAKNLSFSNKKLPPKLSSDISLKPSFLSNLAPKDTKIQQYEEEKKPLYEMWREIQGCKNWEGLLDPMNSNLRKEIIRYGEFAQSCYDSFDYDPHSKYCGTCKYQPSHFFEKLNMVKKGYEMRRYLYATSNINLPNFFQKSKNRMVWSQHANWIGYVVVATDPEEIKRLGRRGIVVAWRGTVTYLEWIHDLKDILHPAHFRDDPNIKIESGFFDLYTQKEKNCHYCSFSAREQILAEINRLIEKYEGEELSITITGHSLGAALALLSAYDIAEMKLNILHNGLEILNLKKGGEELGIRVLRVINVHDKVPTVPGIITNEKFQFQKQLEETISFPWSYAHVGVELTLDHHHSPFLKPNNDLGCAHNLEAHLHLVDGYHGKDRAFCSATGRDVALVNKDSSFLKKDYGVPPMWWQDANKGMVRTPDGRWVLPERPIIEAHPPDTAHHFQQVLKLARARLHLP
ncbi:phospholipase a1-igamma3, chloroplastic [Nicotiana attenuata]|uniref:Phospholipase a1-igamma3, chloroplastic n=1 Tax=Nicotiana attenuata TaxID=49451 RepID=A0A314L0A3_NICAT|nr:phospholipase a1-igamma3, chloroplastic [Nicotiana attenuata]